MKIKVQTPLKKTVLKKFFMVECAKSKLFHVHLHLIINPINIIEYEN
jgi:hypothetical protein